jgi:hypothetical protein
MEESLTRNHRRLFGAAAIYSISRRTVIDPRDRDSRDPGIGEQESALGVGAFVLEESMPKKTQESTPAEPKLASVIAMVPLTVRNRVDQLAQREQVSRSEIGRRALEQFMATHDD